VGLNQIEHRLRRDPARIEHGGRARGKWEIGRVPETVGVKKLRRRQHYVGLAEAQKGDFIKWVAAVCNAQTEVKSPQIAAMPPRDAGAPQIRWEAPESWTEVPPSSMRYASFSALAENGDKIDISVVTFAGDGGSDADNVNRWRGQIGLSPVDQDTVNSQITPLKSADTTFSTTDIAGSKARTIAAWTHRDGRVWFFKATGPNAAVEKEKPNFVKFIESVRF